jgi:DNA-binding NarL/FixJ family response regulator
MLDLSEKRRTMHDVNIRVVMIDDQNLIREALCEILMSRPGITVVGQADNGRTGVEMVAELAPHVVVMDISMPELNGIDATRRILAENPGVKILALSMHSDPHMVAAMLKAGAHGYVLKDAALADLRTAIETVMTGRPYFSPQVNRVLLERFLAHSEDHDGETVYSALTAREREVLQLLAEGLPTKAIAVRLDVSVKTVEKHRTQLMEKLDLHSVAELTKYAVREGLSTL